MRSPYLLIPEIIIIQFLYLFTYFLMRSGIITKVLHRKIWNGALLITFLVTALLGMLLVIQINYKLEWSFIKIALKWHVDFGIAMSLVVVFHFLWHLKYYTTIFSHRNHTTKGSAAEDELPEPNLKIHVLIVLSGFLYTVIQVLLIRAITTIFQGNEMMMAWVLGVWMSFSGAGVLLGRSTKRKKIPEQVLFHILLIVVLLSFISVLLLYISKNSLFLPGVMVHPLAFFLVLMIVLLPVCLLSGFVVSSFIKNYASEKDGFVKVYMLEAVGSVVGGLAVSFILLYWLSVLQSLILIATVSLLIYYGISGKNRYLLAVFGCALFMAAFFIFPLEKKITSFLFPNQKILLSKETFHGNITITESFGQKNFYSNGSLLFTSDNTILNEEYVHYALLQHPNPKTVLLVSGGIAGMTEEIFKYPGIERIDYVELNPWLIQWASSFIKLTHDPRLHLIYSDGRMFVRKTHNTYDAVLFAVPDPSSFQINRYYTDDFIRSVKNILNPGAVILYGLSPAGNYLSREKICIEAALYQALKNTFYHVTVVPGERDYFLASDSSLSLAISEKAGLKAIDNIYVNSSYMDDVSINERSEYIIKTIENSKVENTDDRSIPVYYYTMNYLSRFRLENRFLWIIPVLILIVPLLFMRSAGMGMYITGFTAAAIEILLIFTFQIALGYVYSALGFLVAVFMGGLAVGAFIASKYHIRKNHVMAGQGTLVVLTLIFATCGISGYNIHASFWIWILYSILTLLPSAAIGFQYVAFTRIESGVQARAASNLYAIDLFGSAIGVIIVTLILVPMAGITNTWYILAFLNVLVLLRILFSK